MKKIILFIFVIFLSNSFGDLVSLYRTGGIDKVQMELEKKLQSKEYWKSYLKDVDVSYGYYESKKFVLVAQKNSKKIELFKKEDDKFLKLLTKSMISGEKDGDKQIEGDLKTPVGAYRLTRKLTGLDQFYGPFALVTNYPNTFDKALNKNGHGIWIHGMPLESDREDFTKGCIALDNDNLVTLEKNMDIDESVLIISENSSVVTSKDEISKVLSFIYSWTDAWRVSDFDKYLSYYDKNFKRDNGEDYNAFKNYKKQIFSRKQKKTIKFSNINIMPYPNSLNKKMFKIVMDQYYKTNTYFYEGIKELYVYMENDKIFILTEG